MKKFDSLTKTEIQKYFFNYYISFPFNNILHFDLNQVLESIVETKNESLI